MIGPKLFILLFLALTAEAQNRRPPPRRPVSNGLLGRPVPIGSVSIPKPLSITPEKIKLELPSLNFSKLRESTPDPNVIIVYPEEPLPDSLDNLSPNDVTKPLPDPDQQPDEPDFTTRYPISDPEGLEPEPKPYPNPEPNPDLPVWKPLPPLPDPQPQPNEPGFTTSFPVAEHDELVPEPKPYPYPEPQPDEPNYTTSYPIIYPEGLEPEPNPYPDPEPQPDEPDFTTRYPLSDPEGLDPEPKPYPDPEPQPDEPDYTTRYPINDPEGLEPEPKPYPYPEPQPDEPDYTTHYPVVGPNELEPEPKPYPNEEPQPDEPDYTTPNPIIDPEGLEPGPKPYPDPEPQPDEPEYTTYNPVVDPEGLEPEPKHYPDPEPQPDEPDYTTQYPVIDPTVLEPEPKPYPDPEPQPDEPEFTTPDPNIGNEGLKPENKPDPDPKPQPNLPNWKPPIPTLPPLNPYIPPYYPYQPKPIVGYTCRQVYAYYAVPRECNTYVECRKSIAFKQECPDGFHFNPRAVWPEDPCVHSSQVNCENKTSINWPKPMGECPQRFGSFPAKTGDCGKYIVCDEGRAHFMTCPSGLAFNPIISGCDWPEQVPNCKPNVFEDFTCPLPAMDQYNQPLEQVTHHSYRNSCKEYIACLRGEPRLLRCDSGLHFDPITRRCIDANKVKNCGTIYSRTYYRRLKQGTL